MIEFGTMLMILGIAAATEYLFPMSRSGRAD